MTKQGTILKRLLSIVIATPPAEAELPNLVYYARSLAESYLLHFRFSFLRLCQSHGLSATDIALDCIADLFRRDSDGRFVELQRFSDSLSAPVEAMQPEELFLAFNSLVVRFTNAQAARNYAQIDPAGSRIHRNLRDQLRLSKKLKLVEGLSGYVIEPRHADLLDHHPRIPYDLLARWLENELDRELSIPKVLNILNRCLMQQRRFQRSVVLFELVQILKTHTSAVMETIPSTQQTMPLDELTHHDLRIVCRDVLRYVQQKIASTYLLPGKVTKAEAQVLNLTLEHFLSDVAEYGEQRASFFEYLQRHQQVSQQEYENVWRTKVEYLARLARERMTTWFMENL